MDDLIAALESVDGFDYMRVPGEPLLGLVRVTNAGGERCTLIGAAALVAAWQATPEKASEWRLGGLQQLLDRGEWIQKRGWPDDWSDEEHAAIRRRVRKGAAA